MLSWLDTWNRLKKLPELRGSIESGASPKNLNSFWELRNSYILGGPPFPSCQDLNWARPGWVTEKEVRISFSLPLSFQTIKTLHEGRRTPSSYVWKLPSSLPVLIGSSFSSSPACALYREQVGGKRGCTDMSLVLSSWNSGSSRVQMDICPFGGPVAWEGKNQLRQKQLLNVITLQPLACCSSLFGQALCSLILTVPTQHLTSV